MLTTTQAHQSAMQAYILYTTNWLIINVSGAETRL